MLDKKFVGFFTLQRNLSSPQIKRKHIIITKKWMHELPYEMSNDVKKLGNFKKIPEMLGSDSEYPASCTKAKFWYFW